MSNKARISKTHKGIAKRFKVTGTGKIMRRKPGRRHLLEHKSSKRKRNLRKPALVSDADLPRLRRCLPFSH